MISTSKPRKFFCLAVFVIASFVAGRAEITAQASANAIELKYDFHGGNLGWTAGFADYPPNTDLNGSLYELFAGSRFMPRKLTRLPRRGFYIQGHNRSDDLFMYLKRGLRAEDGIVAGQTYRVQFVITLASNAATGCAGIGGAPGEGVVLKAGASAVEPLSVLQSNGYLRMNVHIGDHRLGGTAASVTGNIANGIPCERAAPYYPFAIIERSHQHIADVTANKAGELWLLVGTDSGFEGITKLYYQSIRVKLIPV